MDYFSKLDFNKKPSTLMHIDLNSCFASVEQQSNFKLRDKPIAVAAYNSPAGCIVAPSIEAKRFGVKVGMRVKDGKALCPELQILEPDPQKYRDVHLKFRKVLETYTDIVIPKSIDEFIINLEGAPALKTGVHEVGLNIKRDIKAKVGDWLRVNIGIAPNRFLAKVAAGLHKPDGLDEINHDNYLHTYLALELIDLPGIANNNAIRLNKMGIYNMYDFYNATPTQLKLAFNSVVGYYWYLRLRGWEIDDVDWGRKSFGNSFAIPDKRITTEDLSPILHKLTMKASARMRKQNFVCRGVHVSMLYRSGNHWHQGISFKEDLFALHDIYKKAYKILGHAPYKEAVHTLAVSLFNLSKPEKVQLNLFEQVDKKKDYTTAIDKINDKYGAFVITPAKILGMDKYVLDRISFGGVKELEDFIM